MKGLEDKNVLVTGATSGIGQAIAAYFAMEGANVALNYRNDPDKLDDTEELIAQMCDQVNDCGGRSLAVEGDVSEEADIIKMCHEVVDRLGSLNILINNAGIQTNTAILSFLAVVNCL